MSFYFKISMFDKDDGLVKSIINGTLKYPENEEEREELVDLISDKFYDNVVYRFGNSELTGFDFDKFGKHIECFNEDGCWVLTPDMLREIIEYYRGKVETYYKSLLSDEEYIKLFEYEPRRTLEERHMSEIEGKLYEFNKKNFDHKIQVDDYVVIDSWLYEYAVLNLVYFYKAVLKKNPDKLFVIWGS